MRTQAARVQATANGAGTRREARAGSTLRGAMLALGVAGMLASCSGSPSSSTPTPTSTPTPVATPTPTPAPMSVLTLSVRPDPVVSTDSGDATLPIRVTYVLTIAETAGLGGNIDFINIVFAEDSTGTTTSALNIGADQLIANYATNHLFASTSRELIFSFRLPSFPGGTHVLTGTMTLQFTDDNLNVQTKTLLVHVV